MKRYRYILLFFTITLIACGNLDDFPELVKTEQSVAEEEVPATESSEEQSDEPSEEAVIDETPLTGEVEEVPEAGGADEHWKDFVENFLYDEDTQTWDDGVRTLEITFTDEGATYVFKNKNGKVKTLDTSVLNVSANGAHVTVTAYKKMNYILKGSTTNGSFKIYSDKKFILRLDGVNITNPNGAAINIQKGTDGGKRCFLVVNDGTENYFADGSAYNTPEDEDEKGTVFSEDKVLISGEGYLNIKSTGKHCLVSDDYVYIHKGTRLTLAPVSEHDGIKTNDGLYIAGGVINITCSGETAKGINTDGCLYVTGGRTIIINTAAQTPIKYASIDWNGGVIYVNGKEFEIDNQDTDQ